MEALHKLILFPTGQGHHKEAMEQLGYKARVLEALKTEATTLSHQNQSMSVFIFSLALSTFMMYLFKI